MKNQSTPTVVLTSLVVIHQFETLKSPANPLAKQKCYFLYVFQVIPLLILKFLCWMGSANDYFCGLDSKGKVNNRFHFSRIPRIQASRPPNHQWNISRLITLQGINISYLGKRKMIFKSCFLWDMLVPRRVTEVWVPKKKKKRKWIPAHPTPPPSPPWSATWSASQCDEPDERDDSERDSPIEVLRGIHPTGRKGWRSQRLFQHTFGTHPEQPLPTGYEWKNLHGWLGGFAWGVLYGCVVIFLERWRNGEVNGYPPVN